ncbi:CLUMA_CG014558, isoform A [Clunio marinus]|uniref:CLUMA_CG014558, isoform A n=1 Tax=Clunio marinus TaxID=568069 RepID=A0A1J1ILC9_9DIPT|nr:CLUMA_CG014558, isoform A [Clunio marinus]
MNSVLVLKKLLRGFTHKRQSGVEGLFISAFYLELIQRYIPLLRVPSQTTSESVHKNILNFLIKALNVLENLKPIRHCQVLLVAYNILQHTKIYCGIMSKSRRDNQMSLVNVSSERDIY